MHFINKSEEHDHIYLQCLGSIKKSHFLSRPDSHMLKPDLLSSSMSSCLLLKWLFFSVRHRCSWLSGCHLGTTFLYGASHQQICSSSQLKDTGHLHATMPAGVLIGATARNKLEDTEECGHRMECGRSYTLHSLGIEQKNKKYTVPILSTNYQLSQCYMHVQKFTIF